MKSTKILIIGQAPPAVKQSVPYDTTLLYEMLEWVNITKEDAQNIFEFDAVCGEFPGWENGGHRIPTKLEMDYHWDNVLEEKIQYVDKVLILGNVARDYINSKPKTWSCNTEFLELIHPSRLNYNRIIQNKENITNKLKQFIWDSKEEI